MFKLRHNWIHLAHYQSNAQSSPGLNSMWVKNFQMFKLDLEKSEESEIKLPTSTGSEKKQENSRKASTPVSYTMLKPLTVWITKPLWKILKELEIPDHLTFILRNLYAGQEATVSTGHGTTDWFQIEKGVHWGFLLSPCLFNLYAEYIIWNAGLDEAQAGIKIARGNISNLRYTDATTLMAGSKEDLKRFLMKVRGEWKSWLKTQHLKNRDHFFPFIFISWRLITLQHCSGLKKKKSRDHGIQSHHLLANRWENNGNMYRFYFVGLQKSLWMVIAAMKLQDVCSLEEKLWQT